MEPEGTAMAGGDALLIAGHSLCLGTGTEVLTLHGSLPVEYLCPGDRVITRDGARGLLSVTPDLRPAGRLARVRAGSLGHDRPETTVWLRPDQPILIRDWRAKALFGRSEALVPVARLADGDHIALVEAEGVRLFTLTFAQPTVIFAGGLEPATRLRQPAAA